MKKMFSLALALIMALALCVPAFAAHDYTITITPPDTVAEDSNPTNESYKAYKIFDATYEGHDLAENAKISYTIDSANPFYGTVAAKTEWFTLTQVNGTSTYVVQPTAAYNTTAAIALADALKAVVDAADATESPDDDIAPDATGVKDGANFKLTVDDKGYYFITSTLGSDIIVDTLSDIEIKSKNDYPALKKEADKTQARFGETVTYTLTITVPDSVDKTVVVTDTMEEGLTFVQFTSGNDLADVSAVNNGQVNTITIAPTADSTAREIVVTYEAYIDTADGQIWEEVNTNEAYLTYSEYKSATVKVDVASYEVTFIKIDGQTKAPLKGVTFKLTEKDGTTEIPVVLVNGVYRVADETVEKEDYAVITTDAKGEIKIQGLNTDKYTLVELTTLDGYNLLAGPFAFAIDGANNYYSGLDTKVDTDDNNIIINNSGTELPSTGGIGTTIFYTVGGLMMAAAVVLFVTKKKLAVQE